MKNKSIYLFELILFAFIIVFKFIFVDRLTNYYGTVLIVFWLASLFVLYKTLGLKKNKTFASKNAIQVTIIITMLYFLLTYLSGMFLGFLRNSYSLSLKNIFNNSFYLIVMIISQELIRTMIADKCTFKKRPLIILTILYIILDIILIFNVNSVNSNLKLFIFIFDSCLPIITKNMLCSYLSYKVGYVPGIIYRLISSIYIYFIPIFPDIGYYISSILGILIPFIIYIIVAKSISYYGEKRVTIISKNLWFINVPLTIILLFIVILVSGLFKYQIMAIGSGSMEPVIYRGDAVIFEKCSDDEKTKVDKGEVLVFRHNGKYITHRVVDKYLNTDGIFVYQTKGDNNADIDNYVVTTDEVVGVVKMKVSYVGFPSLWFQDLLAK